MTRIGGAAMTFQGNLAAMNTLLWKMEETKEVDLSIIPMIESEMSLLSELQNKIVSDKTQETRANFLAYHIVRNLNLTMEKMKVRFIKAKENHDNPVVALDTISLIPVLAEAYQTVESINAGKTISETSVVDKIQLLRNSMSSSKMLISGEEEAKRVSKEDFEEEGKQLADAVKDLYAEKQQDSS